MTQIEEIHALLNGTNEPLTESEEQLIEKLKPLKATFDNLAHQTVLHYEPLINEIIHRKSTDNNQIETIIDNILDMCHYPKVLGIFCKLMRYYFTVDVEAANDYIQIFLENYDESAFDVDAFWERYKND